MHRHKGDQPERAHDYYRNNRVPRHGCPRYDPGLIRTAADYIEVTALAPVATRTPTAPYFFSPTTFFSAPSIAPGAQRMPMKLCEPIIERSGKFTAIRKRAWSAYTSPRETSTS